MRARSLSLSLSRGARATSSRGPRSKSQSICWRPDGSAPAPGLQQWKGPLTSGAHRSSIWQRRASMLTTVNQEQEQSSVRASVPAHVRAARGRGAHSPTIASPAINYTC